MPQIICDISVGQLLAELRRLLSSNNVVVENPIEISAKGKPFISWNHTYKVAVCNLYLLQHKSSGELRVNLIKRGSGARPQSVEFEDFQEVHLPSRARSSELGTYFSGISCMPGFHTGH